MKMSSQSLRKRVNRHLSSATIVAALGAVLDAQATSTSLDPALRVRIDEVLDALGLAGLPDGVSAADVRQILAEIRFNMLLDAKLLFHPTSPLAWTHTETEILQAGGEVSAGFADALTLTIVPRLDGLSQRLGVARWVVSRCWCGRGRPVDRDGASMAVAECSRHRSLGARSGARTRECNACRSLSAHPVARTDGRGSFRYRRLRSGVASQRLYPGRSDSNGLRQRASGVTSWWLASVCDG
jgi:hypothetical protein